MKRAKVLINPRELRKSVHLGATLITSGPQHIPALPSTPSELVVEVKRITFHEQPDEQAAIVRQLLRLERNGKTAIIAMTKNAKVRECYDQSLLWWGWTLVARGDVFTVQMVVFPKPARTDLVGEVDQGSVYEVSTSKITPWDGKIHLDDRVAA
ncbi:MAG: hypothetical protein WC866_01175 [Patescibacteria group bacterium]|jgi:hypothetical protein